MCHLAKDTAVRAGNPFDSHDRLVRIIFTVIGSIAAEVYILCRNLSFRSQFPDLLGCRYKPAFPMGNRDSMDIPCFHIAEPRAHDRNDLRIDHPRQMAANRIVRQRRAVRTQRLDPAIGQEPQFDQRLETVADTQCQPVPLVKQIIQRFFQRRAAE